MHSFDAGYRKMFSSFSVTLIIIRLAFPKWGKEHADPPPFISWQQDPIYVVVGLLQSPNWGRTETEMS
jgi:hypothetical protein